MERLLDLTTGEFPAFLLVFFRMTGVFLFAPVLGNQALPLGLKGFLSLLLAFLFFPLVDRAGVTVDASGPAYLLAAAAELGVGILIGFAASLLFAGVQFAGQILDQELGLLVANVLDPMTDQPISIVGQFKALLAMTVYLLIDGHHLLVSALLESYRAVPLLGLQLWAAPALFVSDAMMRDVLRMGVQIAAPALVTLFLITIALAFMARTVPEMNIFALGFALRLGVGLGVLALGVGLFVYGFQEAHFDHTRALRELMRLLGGGSS